MDELSAMITTYQKRQLSAMVTTYQSYVDPEMSSEEPIIYVDPENSSEEPLIHLPIASSPGSAGIRVIVMSLDAKPFSRNFNVSNTIWDMKVEIQRTLNIPPEQQKLIFETKDGKLSNCKKVHCVRKLKGGAWSATNAFNAVKDYLDRYNVTIPPCPPTCGPNARDAAGKEGYLTWKAGVVSLAKELLGSGRLDSRAAKALGNHVKTLDKMSDVSGQVTRVYYWEESGPMGPDELVWIQTSSGAGFRRAQSRFQTS